MRHWFQNLNKNKKKWFDFRGAVYTDTNRQLFRYQICSGFKFKIEYTHGEACDNQASSMIILGLFFATLYLTFHLPESWYPKKRCVATWDNNREFFLIQGKEYGFYFYEWALVWKWGTKVHESSSRTPWYRSFYFRIDDFFLGRSEVLSDEMLSVDNVQFKIGDKVFTMDNIKWFRKRAFRQYLPFVLYNHKWISVEMKIDKPPMRAGKGENSWDCDDDGTYGLYSSWKGSNPSWDNKKIVTREAIEYYCAGAIKDAKKYGRGSGEHGIAASDLVQILEPVKKSNEAVEAGV